MRDFGLARPKSLFVHCVWLNDEDIKILADAEAFVCHCPSSNLKLGSGVASVAKMVKMGLNVTLGTDGGPSNDMLREMKLAAILQKDFAGDPTIMPLRDVVALATLNGAVGEDGAFGTIEEGKKADIAVFNLKKPHLYPPNDPLSNLIYAGCGHDAEYVVVDGKLVVEGGRVLTLDEEEGAREGCVPQGEAVAARDLVLLGALGNEPPLR